MPNDIDDLMDRDPLALSERDLDAIIAYHRNSRANAEAPKGKRPAAKSNPETKLALADLVKGLVADKSPAPAAKPKSGGGLRRI